MLTHASPHLSGSSPASFSLPEETLSEIELANGAESVKIGVMSTQWAMNPWATEEVQSARQPVSLRLLRTGTCR